MTIANQRKMMDADGLAGQMRALGQAAKQAAAILALADRATKDRALLAMAAALRTDRAKIITANAADMDAGRSSGLTAALLDRLMLDEKRVEAMARGLCNCAAIHLWPPNPRPAARSPFPR